MRAARVLSDMHSLGFHPTEIDIMMRPSYAVDLSRRGPHKRVNEKETLRPYYVGGSGCR
jgi:hypothetical protein